MGHGECLEGGQKVTGVSKLHVPGTQRRSNHTLSQLQETSEEIEMNLFKDKLKDMDSITQKNGPW